MITLDRTDTAAPASYSAHDRFDLSRVVRVSPGSGFLESVNLPPSSDSLALMTGSCSIRGQRRRDGHGEVYRNVGT